MSIKDIFGRLRYGLFHEKNQLFVLIEKRLSPWKFRNDEGLFLVHMGRRKNTSSLQKIHLHKSIGDFDRINLWKYYYYYFGLRL